MTDYIPATPANMRRYACDGLAVMGNEGEIYSGDAADYWLCADDEPVGPGTILVIRIPETHKPLLKGDSE